MCKTRLALAVALWRFWERRGYVEEGLRRLEAAGRLAYHRGEHERAAMLHEEALALWRDLGDRQGVATSLNSLGNVARRQGQYGRAAALYEEALALARELGDRSLCALALTYLGHSASRRGDAPAAVAHYQEALRLCRATSDYFLLAYVLEGRAWATRGSTAPPRRCARRPGRHWRHTSSGIGRRSLGCCARRWVRRYSAPPGRLGER